MQEQTPEPLIWKCPLCSADNEMDAETYKICGSCGWGNKKELPERSQASVGIRKRLWEAGKSLALALFITTGLFALILKFLFTACGL